LSAIVLLSPSIGSVAHNITRSYPFVTLCQAKISVLTRKV